VEERTFERLLVELARLRELVEAAVHTPSTEVLDVDQAQWLAGILAHSPDVISILDREGRLLYLSRSMVGRPADIVGHLAREYVPEPHRGQWDDALRRAIDTGEPQGVEVMSRGDFWWETRIVPIRRGSAVTNLLTIGREISASKRAERAIALRDEHLAMVSAALDVGFWRLHVATDEVTTDASARALFGLPPEAEVVDLRDALARIHPEDVDRVRRHLEKTIGSGVYDDQEFRFVLPDGRTRWALVKAKVLRTDQGEAVDVVGAILDVTRTRQQEELAHRGRRLEAIGQLAGGVAHDFNNVLVAILGNIGLAAEAPDPRIARECLDEALRAGERAASLTRQLLAFGRRQHFEETLVDVDEVIGDTLKLLRRLIPESIRVEHIAGHRLPRLLADRGQLEQVILNLCVNARDAMPAGGKLVLETEVVLVNGDFRESHPWARPGRYVLVTVTDSGSGIPPDQMDRVFEPFFTTKEHGTGLGLATVYGIVKQHGGFVHVYSEVGKGTTFKVYLPVAERDAGEVGTKIEEPVRGGVETILVAEDERAVRSIVVRILERAGYHVLEASDGKMALDTFRANAGQVKLLLLDAIMPNLGGHDVLAAVRAERPEIPVILSSGYGDAQVDPAAHAVTFLAKPYEPDALLRAVRAALDGPAPPKV